MIMSWRSTIPELLSDGAFRTQAALADAIARRTGQVVDQSTVSRELSLLGVRKFDGIYRMPAPPSLGAPIHDLRVTANGCLAVVITDPAHASVLGQAVDDSEIEGVIGTIAGDNALFVALSGPDAVTSLRRFLGLSGKRRV